jgi:ABC-2 type transport system ATP-binding protein
METTIEVAGPRKRFGRTLALDEMTCTVAATGPGTLTVAGLPAERAVVLLSEHAIPFSEVTTHRATHEETYLELTEDAVEFQSGRTAS